MTVHQIDIGQGPDVIDLDSSDMGKAFKQAMIDGDLKKAKAPCPNCDGTIYGHIAGRVQSLHAKCLGSCGFEVTE